MRRFKIGLYGNLILDRTFSVREYSANQSNVCHQKNTSPGGIANVLYAVTDLESSCEISVSSAIGSDETGNYISRWLSTFQKLNPFVGLDLDIEKRPGPTSEAVIISETDKGMRSSIVSWGACTEINTLKCHDKDWCHILYADKLPDIDISSLKKLSQSSVISIDLCSSNFGEKVRSKIEDMLPYVDVVFGSYEEGMCLANKSSIDSAAEAISKLSRGSVVLHSPEESTYVPKDHTKARKFKNVKVLDGPLNVLGAGDMFASGFMVSSLRGNDLSQSIALAHEYVYSVLKKRQANVKV